MKKIILTILIISLLLIFGCTENNNDNSLQNTQNNSNLINTPLEERIPSFSCISKDVLENTWHCVQIYEDTPKETADWWQEKCDIKAANRSLSNSPCEVKDYVCMTPNNWTAEFYYNTNYAEVDDGIKNKCEKA